MLDPNEFAFPSGDREWDGTRGLSVREHVAVQLLTGLLASGDLNLHDCDGSLQVKLFSRHAVSFADALIAELNKPVAPVTTEESKREKHADVRPQNQGD